MATILHNADIIAIGVGMGGLGAIGRDLYANGVAGVNGLYVAIALGCFGLAYFGFRVAMRRRP